jgi:protein-disulfide isomerase
MASDFQCPFCKQWHDSTMPPIVQNYVKTGKVRLAYINFPLGQHQNALPAAEAAMCAAAQDKFWPLHDSLFTRQQRWSELPNALPMFDSLAMRVGVQMPAWRKCVSSHAMMELIKADRDRGASAGVQSTPTFFIGTQRVAGSGPVNGPAYPYFKNVIEAELAKARAAKKPGS